MHPTTKSSTLPAHRPTLSLSVGGSCLKTGQHSIFVIIYKENKKNNVRMLDTLFIEDFTDSMEEYFHF